MKTNSTFLERYSLALFIILTPLISIAIPLGLPLPAEVVAMLMAFIPPILALLLTGMAGGRKNMGALLRKLLQWRIDLKWYAVALGLPLGLHLAMSLVALLMGWITFIQIRPWSLPQFFIVAIIMLIAAPLEELGWRGYALPRLLAFRSPLFSALLIGVAWGILHLPLSAPGMVNAGAPWMAALLMFIGFSTILTWLFIQTQGNLVLISLCHAGMNYFGVFNEGIPAVENAWLQAVLMLTVAFVLILLFGANLQRSPVKKPVIMDAG